MTGLAWDRSSAQILVVASCRRRSRHRRDRHRRGAPARRVPVARPAGGEAAADEARVAARLLDASRVRPMERRRLARVGTGAGTRRRRSAPGSSWRSTAAPRPSSSRRKARPPMPRGSAAATGSCPGRRTSRPTRPRQRGRGVFEIDFPITITVASPDGNERTVELTTRTLRDRQGVPHGDDRCRRAARGLHRAAGIRPGRRTRVRRGDRFVPRQGRARARGRPPLQPRRLLCTAPRESPARSSASAAAGRSSRARTTTRATGTGIASSGSGFLRRAGWEPSSSS